MTRSRRLSLLLVLTVLLSAAWTGTAWGDPVIAAAGDIACDPNDSGYNGGNGTSDRCQQRATSDLLVNAGLSAVLPLGDIQYDSSSAANIAAVYDPTWGRVKSISRPILGNHEGSATGYFDYFNGVGVADGPAGPRGKGFYSFDVGSWHLVALNSNCTTVSCAAGSEQEQWLRADLAAHASLCTLAYWHHPRFSSGHDGSNDFMQPLWQALDDAGVEILLSGHSHDYERFAALDSAGNPDPALGIRQFVVGTGGAFFTGGVSTRIPYSEIAQNDTFGVLKLVLHPSSYDWQFVPIPGQTFTDAGSDSCHASRWQPPPPPPAIVDQDPPVISKLRVARKRFTRRTVIRYSLSEPALVSIAVKRKMRGGRYKLAGRFGMAGVAGHNGKRWRGRIGKRRLKAGTFRITLTAYDSSANRSRPRSVAVKIVRPPRRARRGARATGGLQRIDTTHP